MKFSYRHGYDPEFDNRVVRDDAPRWVRKLFFRRYWKGYFKLINFRILASSLYQYMTLYMSYWLWMMKNLMSIN